jgi:hypothetical protein
VYPYVTAEEVDVVLDSFSHAINFAYPTMSRDQLVQCSQSIVDASVMQATDSAACLSLLAMALGCASEATSGLLFSELNAENRKWRASRRAMGDVFFDLAMKWIPFAHTDISSTAAQCLLLVA